MNPAKSKSKAIYVVGNEKNVAKPKPLTLCGQSLPWVERAVHLGHVLSSDGKMTQDSREKYAEFVDRSVKLRETFRFAHPSEQIAALDKYCSSAYSSCLWDLSCAESQKYFSAWNTALKLSWDVPRACRTYIVQQVLSPDIPCMRTKVLSRFHGFFLGLLQSPSREIQTAARISARDIRRNLGANVRLLYDTTGVDPWDESPNTVKRLIREKEMVHVDEDDLWRLSYLRRLLSERTVAHYQHEQDKEESLQSLIDSLVIN